MTQIARWLPRFRAADRALATLETREAWPRERIEALQLARINAVWRDARRHVPYFRAPRPGTAPAEFSSLAEFTASVPLLTKADVRAHAAALLSESASAGRWHHTSGSTGAPTATFRSDAAHREMLQARYRFFQAWGLDAFDRTAFLWGRGAAATGGLHGWAAACRQGTEDRLRRRLRLSAYHLGPEELRAHLVRIAAFRPAAIYGLAQAVYLLAVEARATSFHCPSLRAAILTAESVTARMHAAIVEAFGVPAVVEYGATEIPFIAGERPDGTLRVREDLVLVETPPREDGRYDIVCTVLNDPSFPLLRYLTGDVTEHPLRAPAHGFAILRGVAGRDNDLLVTRTGRLLHSARIDGLFEHEYVRAVRRYRIHQAADGSVLAEVEPMPRASVTVALLRERLAALTDGHDVRVELVDAIAPTAAGKQRPVSSELYRAIAARRD